MTIVAAGDGTYEVDLPLGSTIAETICALGDVPADAVLFEHYGDVDLTAVYRLDAPGTEPRT